MQGGQGSGAFNSQWQRRRLQRLRPCTLVEHSPGCSRQPSWLAPKMASPATGCAHLYALRQIVCVVAKQRDTVVGGEVVRCDVRADLRGGRVMAHCIVSRRQLENGWAGCRELRVHEKGNRAGGSKARHGRAAQPAATRTRAHLISTGGGGGEEGLAGGQPASTVRKGSRVWAARAPTCMPHEPLRTNLFNSFKRYGPTGLLAPCQSAGAQSMHWLVRTLFRCTTSPGRARQPPRACCGRKTRGP